MDLGVGNLLKQVMHTPFSCLWFISKSYINVACVIFYALLHTLFEKSVFCDSLGTNLIEQTHIVTQIFNESMI